MYDFAIYGGGPTGMVLAYILAYNKKKVVLVEKESELGGCWKTLWLSEKYFSEHSPRVLFPNNNAMIKILEHFGMNMHKELSKTSPSGTGILSVFAYALKRFSCCDLLKLAQGFLFKNSKNLTVTEWANLNNISPSGKRALRTISVALANSPEKLLMSEILGNEVRNTLKATQLPEYPIMSQFVNHDKWINVFEQNLKGLGVTILKNHELWTFNTNVQGTTIISGNVINLIAQPNNQTNILICAKNHIITFPPVAFYNLMERQPSHRIQNNWMPIQKLKAWMLDSYYASIGFQLHFRKKMLMPKNWCWSCDNDYDLIALDVSKFTKKISKDPTIKSVWSCTVVATDNCIKKRGKTINELDLNTIISDCLRILGVKPDVITVYPCLHKEFHRWISKDTAFSMGKLGTIPPKGNYISNLYTVGPHNRPGITNIGKATDTALTFSQNMGLKIPNYLTESSRITFIIMGLVLLVLVWKVLLKK